ncbi:MAG TPA: 3D domain-containing protein [Vicinamibacterales bacterium]|jgi:3D (Asp-Asp-Asp) domain-containing protein
MGTMIISGSIWRKSVVTVVAAGAFVSLYEVTILDSRYAARLATTREQTAMPEPGARLAFSATAYCKGMTTTSGVAAQTGVAAADPELLPVGSVVELDGLPLKYNGIYSILDTGPSVQGRQLDVYMWSCNEALEFGRRVAHITVLRLGWNPRATTPTFFDRLFRRTGAEPATVSTRRPQPQAANH